MQITPTFKSNIPVSPLIINSRMHSDGRRTLFLRKIGSGDHSNRPSAIPEKRAISPNPFCKNKLAAAEKYCAVRISSPDSSIYVEKVVKAPINPKITTMRVSGETVQRCSKRAHNIPAAKQPVMLTARVPHGNDMPAILCVSPASPYRQSVPAAPAMQSKTMRCTIKTPVAGPVSGFGCAFINLRYHAYNTIILIAAFPGRPRPAPPRAAGEDIPATHGTRGAPGSAGACGCVP